jgi:hypothetical protein
MPITASRRFPGTLEVIDGRAYIVGERIISKNPRSKLLRRRPSRRRRSSSGQRQQTRKRNRKAA